MADERIIDLKKFGFPKITEAENGYGTTIEYIGDHARLAAARPKTGLIWGEYAGLVSRTTLTPQETTESISELVVELEFSYAQDKDPNQQGEQVSKIYEIEWVSVSRSMKEHPVFRSGGEYALTEDDHVDIAGWENEADSVLKKEFKYKDINDIETTLSDNAKKYAQVTTIISDQYEDFAPVVRVTTTYADGIPPRGSAGEKDNPPSFTGGPSGYEWRKSAERSVRSGKETRWDRVEEWIGADKVLIDRNKLYI